MDSQNTRDKHEELPEPKSVAKSKLDLSIYIRLDHGRIPVEYWRLDLSGPRPLAAVM